MATKKSILARDPSLAMRWMAARPLWLAMTLLLSATSLAAWQKAKPAQRAGTARSSTLRAAHRRVTGARPLAMYYYYEDTRALESLKANASQITLLGPQCFWVDAGGFVHGAVPPRVAEIVKSARLPVMPLLINPDFDRPTASALLRSDKAQERAIAYMAYLARRDDYVGWQIDMENIDPAEKYLFTQFVTRAAARLHRDGRLLSVAVVPRFSDHFPDQPATEFRTSEWGAPYDFPALGRVVDFLTLMTYEHHGSTTPAGPVAGYAWVQEALHYALRHVPRQKLLLGVPLFGREWVETSEGMLSRAIAHTEIVPLLARPDIEVQWEKRWRSPWFQYREGPELHTIWFDDSRSIAEKLQLVQQYRLRGFAAWRLGSEDPGFWRLAAATGKQTSTRLARRARKKMPRLAPHPKPARAQRTRSPSS